MRIYLYESHLGGLYLSEKDGLNAPCKKCGKSDECLYIWWVDSVDDIRRMIYGLMGFLIQRFWGFNEFDNLCNKLIDMYQVFGSFLGDEGVSKEIFEWFVQSTRDAVKLDVYDFTIGLMND